MEEIKNIDVKFSVTPIEFTTFDELKSQAIAVADYIDSIDLTEDGVKKAKETLANARKVVKRLEDKRKEVKYEILKPYEEFESQIKEIVQIIDTADNNLRQDVKQLEEKQREERKETLKDIWDKRVEMYSFTQYIKDGFDVWMHPAYLNKSTSISRCEAEMVAWMEDTQKDIEMLEKFSEIEYLVEYASCFDVTEAINRVREREDVAERIEAARVINEVEESATFIVYGKSDIKLVEFLLKDNEIKFKRG